MAKQKYYVVWEGRKPGIYSDWETCSAQVQGFAQAKYKAFDSKAEAEKAFKSNYWAVIGKTSPGVKSSEIQKPPAAMSKNAIAVDAACSGNPGDMEYRGVRMDTGEEIFKVGPLAEGTNNIGEFLAIVHGLAWLKQMNLPGMPIYSDSRNAQLWVKAKKCRTKLEPTPRNARIFEMIDRAEKWLAINKVTNPIIKWETDRWGEIPADFGRK